MIFRSRIPRPRPILASDAWLPRALIAGALLVAFWVGRDVANESQPSFLVVIGVLAGTMLVKNPIWGFYLIYPLFFLRPFGELRFDFPLLNSPGYVVSLLTLGIAFARFGVQRRPLPSSAPYGPLATCVVLLAVFTAIGHGPDSGWYLYRFVEGLWPICLVILLVETPRQARNVLIALFVSAAGRALRYLPDLLRVSAYAQQTGALFTLARGIGRVGIGPTAAGQFLLVENSWQSVQAIALALIPLFALAMFSERPRLRYLCGAIVVAGGFTAVTSSYLSAMLVLGIGITIVLLLGARLGWVQWRISTIVLVVVLIAVTVLSPPGHSLLDRLLNPWDDAGIIARQSIYIEGVRAFLESPLVGWGAHRRGYVTPGGNYLEGHSSFIPVAYQFGLVFLVPLFLVFWQAGQNFRWLLAQPLSHTEKVLLVGTLSAFVTYLIFGIFAMTLFEFGQDAVVWLFVGLTVVWRNWLEGKTYDRLVA